MAAGWAVAGDTPVHLDEAGRLELWRYPQRDGDPLAQAHQGERARCAQQFHHVIDIAPTVLEAAGLPEPKIVNGTKQAPIEGVSMVYTFGDARAKSRHQVQYFEILGNRGIYADGWFAGTVHRRSVGIQAAQPPE